MKYCGRMVLCALAGITINAGAIVAVSNVKDGPYCFIERRNLFGLLPPVNSRTEAPAPIIPRPKVTLAGITTLLGYKTVFLMLPESRAGGVRECLVLREGETQEGIQVREIGDKAVKVVNHGEEQILSFDDNPPEPPRMPVVVDGPVDKGSPIQMAASAKPLTQEQQILVLEAQRMKAMQDGDPVVKILPPTEHTAEITDGTP